MTNKEELLEYFVNNLKKPKGIKSIIQIGSSLWDERSKDIDIIIVTKGKMPSFEDQEHISKIKKKMAKKFGVSFGMGGMISDIKKFNMDLVIIPEDFEIFYSFNPMLIYGMALNPYKVVYGKDFFKSIKKKLKANKQMLFKFGGPFVAHYLTFIIGFDGLNPKNSKNIISMMKIGFYPLIFMKGKHIQKKDMISFLKKEYKFFNRLCKKYKIKEDFVYKDKFSMKEIKNIYEFSSELMIEIHKNFY